MKILVVANYHESAGGISGVVYNHVKKIIEEGHTISIFNTKRNPLVRAFLIFQLLIKIRKFNIIHIHGCSGLGFFPVVLGIIASKVFYSKRTIVTYHGGGAETFLRKHSRFIRTFLSKADCLTVMSGFLQKVFSKYSINTTILPNLINVNVKEGLSINFDVPILISIRALKPIYNIDDIIDAFSIIRNKYPDTQLKIAGTGDENSKLLNLSEKLQLTNITFKGALTNKQIPDELLKSNIMITVPSFDNQPMSVLEAFACGIPVISSNVGGIPYMIEEGKSGFLVDVHKPEQIAEKVVWIMKNPEETKRIIDNAKRELKRYQWSSIKSKLFDIYEGKCIN